MYAVTDLFLRSLRASHAVEVQVDAYRDDTLVLANVPISDGNVQVDSGSQIRRTLSLTVADPALDPGTDPLAPLAPYGTELHVRRGIRFPDGAVEWCPLGWFRIEDVQSSASGKGLSVTGADRGAAVQDARFTSVQASVTGNTVVAEIARLVRDVLPDATVRDYTGSTATTPALFWEQDRWPAIVDLGKAIGADVFFSADGELVIAPVPAITATPAWWVDAGESGVMVDASRRVSREGTYNAVVVSGEAADLPPVTATVTDNDPASATLWGGAYGKKPYFYVSPLITTQAQATSAATAMLDRVRGMSRQLDLSMVPNPALEAGDVVRVRFPDGVVETHLLDGFTIPLDPRSAMTASTRSPKPEVT